jgi:hypothetical protein
MLGNYIAIAQAVQAAVPEIKWADIDKGQLDDLQSYNSLVRPAILVGLADIDWSQLGQGYQQGTGLITVKTIIGLPSQTHLADPFLMDSLKQVLEIGEKVNGAVSTMSFILSRVKYREYPIESSYVIEQIYEGVWRSGPKYIEKRITASINPQIYDPAKHATA